MPVEEYVYDGDTVLQVTDGSGVTQTEYTSTGQGYGDLLSAFDGSAAKYYEPDALGSTDALSDQSQAVVDRWAYRAFGSATQTLGTDTTPFTWVGRQGYYADDAIDLYQLGNGTRYYDPAVAQFLSDDPIGFAGGDPNLRRYVRNRSIVAVDPTGTIEVRLLPDLTIKGGCGKRSQVAWDFILNEQKQKQGYLIQKITVRYRRADCDDFDACKFFKSSRGGDVQAIYWEAFLVQKNRIMKYGRNQGDLGLGMSGLATDYSQGDAKTGTWGQLKVSGEIRFVYATPTFDPDELKIPKGWKLGHENPIKFKEYPELTITSGDAYYTLDKPPFWDDGYVVEEGTAYRSFTLDWACCGKTNFTKISHSEQSS